MPGMFHVTLVFKFIIYSFDRGLFSKTDPVREEYKRVFHVLSCAGYQMDAIDKKFFKQVPRDISPVTEQFPECAPVDTLVFSGSR
jgi:hypothetical protein